MIKIDSHKDMSDWFVSISGINQLISINYDRLHLISIKYRKYWWDTPCYHLKQNEPTMHAESHIMQLVHCACIFRGQVNVLQYTFVGATMISFSLQYDKAVFSTLFCFSSLSSVTFKINWQQITGLKHWSDGFQSQKNLKMSGLRAYL